MAATTADLDRRTAYVVIEAHATWSSFCRCFYVSCAIGARDSSGAPVLPATLRKASEPDAITFAVHTLNPKKKSSTGPWSARDEPTWHDTSDFRRAVQALGTTNLPAVFGALSLAPGSLRDLTTFRNFYAHRGRETARKSQAIARRYLLPHDRHPTEILNDYATGRPQVLLADMVDDIDAVIALLN